MAFIVRLAVGGREGWQWWAWWAWWAWCAFHCEPGRPLIFFGRWCWAADNLLRTLPPVLLLRRARLRAPPHSSPPPPPPSLLSPHTTPTSPSIAIPPTARSTALNQLPGAPRPPSLFGGPPWPARRSAPCPVLQPVPRSFRRFRHAPSVPRSPSPSPSPSTTRATLAPHASSVNHSI